MKIGILLAIGVAAGCLADGQGRESQQTATITGERGPGRCVVELEVDGSAEIYLRDQTAMVRTLSGRPAVWRRYQCNQPIPRGPNGFQIHVNHGRGDVRLTRDGGGAVVRIDDPKGGSDVYTFTLDWRPDGGMNGGGYGSDYDRDRDRDRDRERFDWNRDQLAKNCAAAVADRLRNDGYRDVQITGVNVEDRPGRRDRVLGRMQGRENFGVEEFVFSCGVDLRAGTIRTVDVVPR